MFSFSLWDSFYLKWQLAVIVINVSVIKRSLIYKEYTCSRTSVVLDTREVIGWNIYRRRNTRSTDLLNILQCNMVIQPQNHDLISFMNYYRVVIECYYWYILFGIIIKIIRIADEEKFSKTTVRCITSNFVKIILCPRWIHPPLSFEAVSCFVCGHRKIAVSRYWMSCLVLNISYLSDFNHVGNACTL